MIIIYDKNIEVPHVNFAELDINQITWIDLLAPSKEEEQQIEKMLDIDIPTRAEMKEIEISSRLYQEDNVLFMTAMMVAKSTSLYPKLDPVTFILTEKHLITIRYIEPQAFNLCRLRLKKLSPNDANHYNAIHLLIELLDATIDRLADILEGVGHDLEKYSKTIFRKRKNVKLDYKKMMQQIGANGDLNTKTRESLLTFNRLMAYFIQKAGNKIDQNNQERLNMLSKDILSLTDYVNFLSTKTNFLLDAILGMVSIEQNNIIKFFSVVAVIFLPPTLIASIYGMNFHYIPELSWRYGYLFALGLVLLAGWLPYKYFKYKKWI